MTPSKSNRLGNTTNELAKERNRAAAERTLSAWIGNSLTLMGLGFATHEIASALHQRFPNHDAATDLRMVKIVCLFFISSGIMLLAIALIQHRIEVKSVESENYLSLSVSQLNRIVITAVSLLSSLGIIILLLQL